jgi:hypothetical protein
MSIKHHQEQELRGDMFVMGQRTGLNKRRSALDELEVRCIQHLIRTKQPGKYTLRQLFAEHWYAVRSPRSFGRRVKRFVNDGVFPGLELRKRNASKSWVYELSSASVPANDPLGRIAA